MSNPDRHFRWSTYTPKNFHMEQDIEIDCVQTAIDFLELCGPVDPKKKMNKAIDAVLDTMKSFHDSGRKIVYTRKVPVDAMACTTYVGELSIIPVFHILRQWGEGDKKFQDACTVIINDLKEHGERNDAGMRTRARVVKVI